jgi:hypothetical protein
MDPDHQPRCTYCDDRGCSECQDINDRVECQCCDGSGCPECIPNWEEEERIRLAEDAQEQARIAAWEEQQDVENMFDLPYER